VDFNQRQAASTFVDGVNNQEMKQHLLKHHDRSLNKALKQTLKLEAAKVAGGPPVRLLETRAGATMATWCNTVGLDNPHTGSVGTLVINKGYGQRYKVTNQYIGIQEQGEDEGIEVITLIPLIQT
jgi:hypothetical protein